MILIAQETGFTGLRVAPLFEDYGIPLAIMGIFVVFVALMLVSSFITLLPRMTALITPGAVEKKKVVTAEDDGSLSEEMQVVIAAAVAAALDEPHRIVWTRELTPEDLAWSRQGRAEHHRSHRTHTRDRR